MVVVADTSPINYLVLISQIDLLQLLYKRVLIPPAVMAELTHPRAPEPVRAWARAAPRWLEVLSPTISMLFPQLDPGETEAIALAIEIGADVLIIDEQAGRREATGRGVKVAGTLAILRSAFWPGAGTANHAGGPGLFAQAVAHRQYHHAAAPSMDPGQFEPSPGDGANCHFPAPAGGRRAVRAHAV